jgi:hypothetical protein
MSDERWLLLLLGIIALGVFLIAETIEYNFEKMFYNIRPYTNMSDTNK